MAMQLIAQRPSSLQLSARTPQLSAQGRVESVTKEENNKEKFDLNFVYLFLGYGMFDIN